MSVEKLYRKKEKKRKPQRKGKTIAKIDTNNKYNERKSRKDKH
jgi:hypothetical protein